MAEDRQPPTIVEGATTGDVEDEIQSTAKSAEDRKAAAALAKLDGRDDEAAAAKDVDHEAVSKAMKNLAGGKKPEEKKEEVKKVKVDAADVALLVSNLLASSHLPFPFSSSLLSVRRRGSEMR